MELPKPTRLLKSVLLGLLIYALLVPVWFRAREDYARATCLTATRVTLPAFGIPGGVRVESGDWMAVWYTLRDPRTGGWGRVNQRFFDFSDIPLALALAAALLFLSWRRRLLVAAGSVAVLFLCHLGLVTWTAARLTAVLGNLTLPPAEVDRLLHETASKSTGFGNISAVVTVGVVGALAGVAAATAAHGAPGGDGSGHGRHPAGESRS